MSSKRITERVSASFVCIAKLTGHELRYHKVSKDGSGKCDIYETSSEKSVVHGVVYEIADDDKQKLDRCEGLGNGYEEKIVRLSTSNGDVIEAVSYYATNTDSSLRPYDWYVRHVLEGAWEFGLDEAYISQYINVECVEDGNEARRTSQFSIYK